MEKDRTTLVLYTSANCNLCCSYCYIDKNPALGIIDNILEESFQSDYYPCQIKATFPDTNQLTKVETWGGEPFLGMHRIYDTLRFIINEYTSFNTFFSSTNLTLPDHVDRIKELLDIFGEFPNRLFTVSFQLSIDGPDWVSDISRGKGTTSKFCRTYYKLLKALNSIVPGNVQLDLHFKPTLDLVTMYKLNTVNNIIEYYKFFDELVDKCITLNIPNVNMTPALPNFACPMPATVKDGKAYAKLCRLLASVENNANHFKHHFRLIPLSVGNDCSNLQTYRYGNYTCGTGYNVIGILPNGMISMCHNGFVDLIEDYKKFASDGGMENATVDTKLFGCLSPLKFTLTKDQADVYEQHMSYYNYYPDTKARLTNIVTTINMLAMVGQVDSKYKDIKEALEAATFYQNYTSYCVRDNYNVTGSITCIPDGQIKLLFNGAYDIIKDRIGRYNCG